MYVYIYILYIMRQVAGILGDLRACRSRDRKPSNGGYPHPEGQPFTAYSARQSDLQITCRAWCVKVPVSEPASQLASRWADCCERW